MSHMFKKEFVSAVRGRLLFTLFKLIQVSRIKNVWVITHLLSKVSLNGCHLRQTRITTMVIVLKLQPT